jgi:hypothetical protein
MCGARHAISSSVFQALKIMLSLGADAVMIPAEKTNAGGKACALMM